jgi:hypothetical protein
MKLRPDLESPKSAIKKKYCRRRLGWGDYLIKLELWSFGDSIWICEVLLSLA